MRKRIELAAVIVLSATALAAPARADDAPRTCGPGLVLGIGDARGAEIVSAACAAAEARGVPGIVRVAVLGKGSTVTVVATTTDPTTGVEHSTRIDTDSTEEARRRAPSLFGVKPLVPPPVAPPPRSENTNAPVQEAPAARSRSQELGQTMVVNVIAPDHTLEFSIDGTSAWKVACKGSCTEELPVNARYRFVDAKGKMLHGFRLASDPSGATVVRFKPRSSALDGFGVATLAVGSLALVAGIVTETDGAGLALLGLAGIGVGGALIGFNGASVKQDGWRDRERDPGRTTLTSPAAGFLRSERTYGATLLNLRF